MSRDDTDKVRAEPEVRRAGVCDAYVDRMTADADAVAAEFQHHFTMATWGVSVRSGTPSVLHLRVMAMTAALGRM